MKEIWENPFANAILKVERADKHIAEIEERLRTSSDSYGPSLHMYSDTGEQRLDYGFTDNKLRPDIALIVGDTIHNLRCALDIAYCGVVNVILNTPDTSKYRKFPIDPEGNGQKLESALTKTTKIPLASPLFDLLVNRIKPYKGGDADILAIHTLDIDDKHHLLIPMLTVVGIRGIELEGEDGIIDRFDIALTRPDFYSQRVRLGAKFKNHGEVRFQVTFRGGTPMQGEEVVPTLRRFSKKVMWIVRILQRMGVTNRATP